MGGRFQRRAALLLLALTATPAAAQQSAPEPFVVERPEWAEIGEMPFPNAASEAGVDAGRVTLRCGFEPNGRLSNCTVVSETPPGLGFGASALLGASVARLAESTVAGAPPGAVVQWTTRFVIADDDGLPRASDQPNVRVVPIIPGRPAATYGPPAPSPREDSRVSGLPSPASPRYP